MTTSTRRGFDARARWAVLVVALAVVGACSSDSAEPDDDDPEGSTTTTIAEVSQEPPAGANGLAFDGDGDLWIAVLDGDEVLHVTTDGRILDRVAVPAGSGPDDVAVGTDGSVYWTGFTSGEVGRIDPTTGESETVATLDPGVNPITFDGDDLLVARTLTGQGLFRIDPATGDVTEIVADPGNLNAFQVGPDGSLDAPLAGDGGVGSVVRIDVETGAVTPVVTDGLGFPASVRWDDDTLYVLQAAPSAELFRIDESGALTGVAVFDGLADNLAFDADGVAYVTGFDQPMFWTVDADGAVGEVAIGES